MTVSGTLLPLPFTDAQRATGSFVLTTNPSSIIVPQGMSTTTNITIQSIQGFSGTVSLTSQSPSPSISITFNPNKVKVSTGGSATSMVAVQAAANASQATYTIILTGTAEIGRKIISSSVLMTATVDPAADFVISANPATITVSAGFSNTTQIILASKNSFAGSISLTATVPFGYLGVLGGQTPVTLAAGSTASTSLQVSTTSSTMPGTYNINVTGTSGGVSHTYILKVTVTSPAPESLTLLGDIVNSPTNATLSLHNNGNTPITLTSYTVTDTSGDSWTLASWTGPIISPGATSPAVILISTSCIACTYNGITGLFQQFFPGHTYTITVTTKMNNQFTFTITA